MKLYFRYPSVIAGILLSTIIYAQGRPDSHAPIGVMGDHTHAKGEFMVSYRFMHMTMKDNLVNADDITSDEIATTIANRFSSIDGQPPTLRVVPTEMTMDMHMLGVMYAPSDRLTLMGMVNFLTFHMDHTTYQGGMGTNVLGEFTTQSSGLGDISLTALFKFNDYFQANLGVSVPTGSIEEEDQILTPMNMEPTVRLPYPMQLGSGTWDLLPGVVYFQKAENLSWGAQIRGTIRLGENDNEFSYGNRFLTTAWGAYRLARWISSSLRLGFSGINGIDGLDPGIVAPVQTANPDFHGGHLLDGHLGINLIGPSGFLMDQRLAIEVGIPFWQSLHGPQLQTTSVLTLGWQYAF